MFYLAVLLQSVTLQRNFDYVHVPEMILGFALLTLQWSRILSVVIALLMISTALCIWPENERKASLIEHPLAKPRTALWRECFRTDLSPTEYRQRQFALSLSPEYFSTINPVEIGEVADWLKSQNVQEGDVIAWHDTPHVVYLELGHTPTFRFMHISTCLVSEENFWRMTIELKKKAIPGAKYVVTDLMHPFRSGTWENWNRRSEAGPDRLPPAASAKLRKSFPYNHPAVFRSGHGHGRYIVHELKKPTVINHFEFEWALWD